MEFKKVSFLDNLKLVTKSIIHDIITWFPRRVNKEREKAFKKDYQSYLDRNKRTFYGSASSMYTEDEYRCLWNAKAMNIGGQIQAIRNKEIKRADKFIKKWLKKHPKNRDINNKHNLLMLCEQAAQELHIDISVYVNEHYLNKKWYEYR